MFSQETNLYFAKFILLYIYRLVLDNKWLDHGSFWRLSYVMVLKIAILKSIAKFFYFFYVFLYIYVGSTMLRLGEKNTSILDLVITE